MEKCTGSCRGRAYGWGEPACGSKRTDRRKEDQLEAAETELADGLLQYQEKQSEFDEQMQDADDQIADAQSKIDEIEKPETYVLDRNTNVGYVCLKMIPV